MNKTLKGTGPRPLQRAEHRSVPLIGTKKESSLHRSLKFRYSGSTGTTETLAGSYVCDGQTSEGELIEVQTGSFGPLKEKVKALVSIGKVRIIHPIIAQKHIELYDSSGFLLRRRKSPRKGSAWDLFNALIYAPLLPLLKNLTIELAVVEIVEKRADDGKGSWRRKGVSITDRSLSVWRHSVILKAQRIIVSLYPLKNMRRSPSATWQKKRGSTRISQEKPSMFSKKWALHSGPESRAMRLFTGGCKALF